MKQAITGAKIFSGNEFFDHKALLIDGEKIIDMFLSHGEIIGLNYLLCLLILIKLEG